MDEQHKQLELKLLELLHFTALSHKNLCIKAPPAAHYYH